MVLIFGFNTWNINNGTFTDSIIVFRMVNNYRILFFENASNIYNENVGYPFVIFLFSFIFKNIFFCAFFINILCFFISLIFIYKICLYISKNRIASMICSLFLFVNPVVQFWVLREMSDIMFMTGIILFIYFSIKNMSKSLLIVFILMLFIRSEAILLFPVLIFHKKEDLKKRLGFSIGLVLSYFLLIFIMKSGGKFNFILLYKNIFEVSYLTNFKNIILNLPYVFQFSGIVFFIAGLIYMIKFEKIKWGYYSIFYTLLIYIGMNIGWKFVQFRHWLPFIPFFIIIFVFFFKHMINESWNNSKILFFILIFFVLYTAYDIQRVGMYRVDHMKDAFMDNDEAGKYVKDINADIILSNIDERIAFYNSKAEYIRFDEGTWIPKIINHCGKGKKIIAVLADRKFMKKPSLPDIFIEDKVFKTEYNMFYPCVPGFEVENTWKWMNYKGKKITQKTRVYKFDQLNFLLMMAQTAFENKEYKQSVFYYEIASKIYGEYSSEIMKRIKINYYMIALNAKKPEIIKDYAKKALKIKEYSEININLEYMLE